MKLRNKRTGEIIEATDFNIISDYNSLAELNKEWEDAPEDTKEHYFITEYGGVYSLNEYEGLNNVANVDEYKQIGNYFETKEEAEKAVKKLKAWKLLKDETRIKFDGIITDERAMLKGVKLDYDRHQVTFDRLQECMDALHLLFGGEEC